MLLLFLFLFLNPLFLYCSNFIMSDPLFTTLSIGWLVQLIWLIQRLVGTRRLGRREVAIEPGMAQLGGTAA